MNKSAEHLSRIYIQSLRWTAYFVSRKPIFIIVMITLSAKSPTAFWAHLKLWSGQGGHGVVRELTLALEDELPPGILVSKDI